MIIVWLCSYFFFLFYSLLVLKQLFGCVHESPTPPAEVSKTKLYEKFSRVHSASMKEYESTLTTHDNPQQNDIPHKAREWEWQTRRRDRDEERNYFHILISCRENLRRADSRRSRWWSKVIYIKECEDCVGALRMWGKRKDFVMEAFVIPMSLKMTKSSNLLNILWGCHRLNLSQVLLGYFGICLRRWIFSEVWRVYGIFVI